MKFELERLVDYSDRGLIDEIRRVGALAPGGVFTVTQFAAHARVSLACIARRFGGWRAALEAAGLAHRHSGRESRGAERYRKSRRSSDAELREELRAIARRNGSTTLTRAHVRHAGGPGYGICRKRFGSWRKALEAAGLECSRTPRRSDRECFGNLMRVWMQLGRQPVRADMDCAPSLIKSHVYEKRFGGWRRALAVFVAHVNGETNRPEARKRSSASGRMPRKAAGEARHASLSLRFAVLTRDKFKCTACGASPASQPGCALHVDHIVQWSRGGKTVIENLRTLCAACNLGRGNRSFETTAMRSPQDEVFETAAMRSPQDEAFETTAKRSPQDEAFETTAMRSPQDEGRKKKESSSPGSTEVSTSISTHKRGWPDQVGP